jgi:uncharacterized protein (UPF0264 family)
VSKPNPSAAPAAAKLLVSVRSAGEAALASAAEVDVVDVKEPSNGALGRAGDGVLSDVVRTVGQEAGRLLSAAMGELIEWLDAPLRVPAGYHFVKFGTAGLAGVSNWGSCFRAIAERVAEQSEGRTRAVAAVYSDSARAQSPDWREALDWTLHAGGGVLLIDTWMKDGCGFWSWTTEQEYAGILDACRSNGIALAAAGSLDLAAIRRFAGRTPDYIAVRGAACRGGDRDAPVCPERIGALRAVLDGL